MRVEIYNPPYNYLMNVNVEDIDLFKRYHEGTASSYYTYYIHLKNRFGKTFQIESKEYERLKEIWQKKLSQSGYLKFDNAFERLEV